MWYSRKLAEKIYSTLEYPNRVVQQLGVGGQLIAPDRHVKCLQASFEVHKFLSRGGLVGRRKLKNFWKVEMVSEIMSEVMSKPPRASSGL